MSSNTIKSKYGFTQIKDEDALLLLEASIENGSDIPEALQDARMIDALLHMKKLHFAMIPNITKTKSGYFRKGSLLSDAFDSIIDGRVNGAFNYEQN
jgi:hypothetical protein